MPRDQLSAERRELPWVRVEKSYRFDGSDGPVTLADLFAGRSQLIVYHFMFAPGLGGGLQELLLPRRPFRRRGRPPGPPRRDAGGGRLGRRWPRSRPSSERMGWQLQMGVVVRQRLQSRLPRLVHAGGAGQGRSLLQLRAGAVPGRGGARRQRVLPGRGRRDLPHLLGLCPRPRHPGRHLQLPRPRAQGPRRGRARLHHGVGPAPRPLRQASVPLACRGSRPAVNGRGRRRWPETDGLRHAGARQLSLRQDSFTLDAEPTEAIECNCSICRRAASLLAAFAPEKFRLETSRDDITSYTFHRHVIRHQFCKVCGCAPFAEGIGPPEGRWSPSICVAPRISICRRSRSPSSTGRACSGISSTIAAPGGSDDQVL